MPKKVSTMMIIAPVEYIPYATINKTATERTPEFEKPFRSASGGASPNVMAVVSAPAKRIHTGIFVAIRRIKRIARIARVAYASGPVRVPSF